jgi:hypothetical protein
LLDRASADAQVPAAEEPAAASETLGALGYAESDEVSRTSGTTPREAQRQDSAPPMRWLLVPVAPQDEKLAAKSAPLKSKKEAERRSRSRRELSSELPSLLARDLEALDVSGSGDSWVEVGVDASGNPRVLRPQTGLPPELLRQLDGIAQRHGLIVLPAADAPQPPAPLLRKQAAASERE